MSKLASKGWRHSRCGPIATVLKCEAFDVNVAKDDVVVKVSKAPLHRVDSAVINGSALGRNKASLRSFPRIGGSEGVGTVVRAGSSKHVKEGDTVWLAPLTGTWAETIAVSADAVHKIDPKYTSLAATASNFLVAQRVLNGYGKLEAGDVVVQNGGSSITAAAVAALARERKLTVVSAAASSPRFASSEARLKSLGSTLVAYNPTGARAAKTLVGTKGARLFLNGTGGRYFNDFVKLVGDGGNVVNFGAQNSFGLMWAGSHQIYHQVSFHGFFLPRYLANSSYEERQTNLEIVLGTLDNAKFSYPTEIATSVEGLPKVWDSTFVSGGVKGILSL